MDYHSFERISKRGFHKKGGEARFQKGKGVEAVSSFKGRGRG